MLRQGELVGLWDRDEDRSELLIGGFGEALSPPTEDRAGPCAQLGALRANAIDGDASRRRRWARVRSLSD